MIIISEYVYINIKLNNTHNIVNNTLEEYNRRYGSGYHRNLKVKCITKFLDKMKNEKYIYNH